MKYSAEQIGEIIKKERDKREWSQATLGGKLNKLSDKQISKYEKGYTIPPMDILIKLCEVFDCELGYLIGEEGYSDGTRVDTDIINVTGLSLEAVQNIQRVTGKKHDHTVSLYSKYEPDRMATILNKLLTAKAFVYLLDSLFDLENSIEQASIAFKPVIAMYGKDKVNEILRLMNGTIDFEHDDNAPELSEEQIEIWNAVNEAIKTQIGFSSSIKPYRYEVKDALEALVYELYPRHYGEFYADELINK